MSSGRYVLIIIIKQQKYERIQIRECKIESAPALTKSGEQIG